MKISLPPPYEKFPLSLSYKKRCIDKFINARIWQKSQVCFSAKLLIRFLNSFMHDASGKNQKHSQVAAYSFYFTQARPYSAASYNSGARRLKKLHFIR